MVHLVALHLKYLGFQLVYYDLLLVYRLLEFLDIFYFFYGDVSSLTFFCDLSSERLLHFLCLLFVGGD